MRYLKAENLIIDWGVRMGEGMREKVERRILSICLYSCGMTMTEVIIRTFLKGLARIV